MSILNVNQIQPVGSGQTVTISATNVDAGSATVTAGTFSGNLSSSGISTFSDTVNVGAGKSIRLYGATSGYSEIIAAAGSSSTTFTLPANGGSASQYLQTDGSGVLSWQTVSSTEYQGPAVSVQRATSTQSLTDSTWTKIQFNSENFDTDGCFDSSTNYRFTPTKAGYYAVHGQVDISYSGTEPSSQHVALYKNGSVEKKTQSSGTGLPYGARVNLNHLVYMNGSSDYLEIFAYVNRTSVIATYSENKTSFHAYWVHS